MKIKNLLLKLGYFCAAVAIVVVSSIVVYHIIPGKCSGLGIRLVLPMTTFVLSVFAVLHIKRQRIEIEKTCDEISRIREEISHNIESQIDG